MNHLRQSWANLSKTAWREPDNFRGYVLPQGGQFSHSKEFLDPDIFDKNEKMHPWIRETVIELLGAFWAPKYGENWKEWTRIYLAGSLASYWFGTPDFDTLVGVNTKVFEKEHPQFAGMSDAETCQFLTQELREGLCIHTTNFTFPPALDINYLIGALTHKPFTPKWNIPKNVEPFGPLELTVYVNAASWDIRVIRPYAAYEMISDKFWVHPIHMDKAWSAKSLDHAFWSNTADLADEIKDAIADPDPIKRQERSLVLYDKIHTERGQAFSPTGNGIADKRALQWVALSRWGILGALEYACHPDRPIGHIAPAIARKYR